MRSSIPISVLILALLYCSVATAKKIVHSEMISYETLRNSTGGDDLLHEFRERPEKVRVTVKCKLKRGEFAWRVEDPDGTVLWRQTQEGSSTVDLEQEFEGVAGEWRIVIDYKEARGKYHIRMNAVIPET